MTYVLIIYHQKNYIIQMNRKKININVEYFCKKFFVI